MGYKEMALDAGYRGEEADAVAQQLEEADRLAEEQYWHDRAIVEAEMIEMIEKEREEMNRKFIGIVQQSKVRPLELKDHGDFIEITHNGRVLIQATHFDFNKATANDLVEIINRSNTDE